MKVLPDFKDKKILVIGDIMLDQYIYGRVSRISPEAPVPVMSWDHTKVHAGGAANVALNVLSLGAQVKLMSTLGQDLSGAKLMEVLEEEKLDGDYILQSEDERTTVKTRLIAGSQHVLRLDEEDCRPLDSVLENKLSMALEEIIDSWHPDGIIVEDYNKGLLSQDLIDRIRKLGVKNKLFLAVDPKIDHFFDYKEFDLLKPNLKEVNQVLNANFEATLEDLNVAADLLKEKMHYKMLMITLGEKGIYTDDGHTRKIIPAQSLDIVDVCGAGDAVISLASLCLIHGLSMEETACWANRGGAAVCQQLGVVAVKREDLTCS